MNRVWTTLLLGVCLCLLADYGGNAMNGSGKALKRNHATCD
jgi:hypothetical protein